VKNWKEAIAIALDVAKDSQIEDLKKENQRLKQENKELLQTIENFAETLRQVLNQ
jgi:cell division protein FtsB